MNKLHLALFAFAVFDAIRIGAFLAQMSSILRDRNGASAISYSAWAMFAATHFSNAIYAATIAEDMRLLVVFGINGTCCVLIVCLTFLQRRRYRAGRFARQSDPSSVI